MLWLLSFYCARCLQHHGITSANIESFQKTGQRFSVDFISLWKCSAGSYLPSLSFPGKKSKSELKSELQVTCDIPVPYTHSEVSGYRHWNQEISFYLRSLNRPNLSFPKPLRSKSIRPPRISRIWGPTKMSSFSSAVIMLGNLLLRYWNLFEIVLSHGFY